MSQQSERQSLAQIVAAAPITPDYFNTLDIPLRAGRDFDKSDTPERPRVAIINEALARSAFPGVSPLGKFIRTNKNNNTPWMEVVGVVGDTRWQDPSSPPPLMLFVSSLQGAGKSLSILVRTSLDEQSLAPKCDWLQSDSLWDLLARWRWRGCCKGSFMKSVRGMFAPILARWL